MKATVHDLSPKGVAPCGFIGIGLPDQPPLVTLYFGCTAQHQTFAEAEQRANIILQALNDNAS